MNIAKPMFQNEASTYESTTSIPYAAYQFAEIYHFYTDHCLWRNTASVLGVCGSVIPGWSLQRRTGEKRGDMLRQNVQLTHG